jgi:hypothetical protein
VTIPDLQRLHEATAHAMNTRNYLRREVARASSDLAKKQAELLQADEVFRDLHEQCEQAYAPRLKPCS